MSGKNSYHIDGIVLAGGEGRRMGGGKAAIELRGEALVRRSVDILSPVCRRVVVTSRPDTPLPANLDIEVAYDAPGRAGPLAGISAGLVALRADDVLILACDLPLAAPAIHLLADFPAGNAVMCVSMSGPQPLCARVPRTPALAVAERLLREGRPSARGLLTALESGELMCPDEWLTNLNTRADLEHLSALLEQRS